MSLTILQVYRRCHRRSISIDARHARMGFPPVAAAGLTWEERYIEIQRRLTAAFELDRPCVGTLEAAVHQIVSLIAAVDEAETADVSTGTAA